MCSSEVRISLGLIGILGLAFLCGCGGGSSSMGTSTGTTVTASFSGATMPDAVAYQAGTSGQFQALPLTGSSVSFTLPQGTSAYGFAYQCPIFVAVNPYSNETIIQATTADTTSLSLNCPSLYGDVNATFDVSAIPDATSVILYVNYWADQLIYLSQPTGSVGLSGIPTGTFDVALVAEGANGALAIQIQRGVAIAGNTNIAFPPMTAADELTGSAPVSIKNVPSSATISGFDTTYNTSGGLSVTLNGPPTGVLQSTYLTVPSSQSKAGDFYLINAGADLSTQSVNAEVSSRTASAVTVALPSPLSSPVAPAAAAFPTFNANTSGFTVKGTVVESAYTQFQSPEHTYYNTEIAYNTYIFVTGTWLGTSTTFTVPDLSTLIGFAPAPPSGAREFWGLYSTAGAPLQFDTLQQSEIETFTSPTSLQSISYGGYFTTS